MTERIEIKEEDLEKYFGADTSEGKTCDCKECNMRNQILQDHEIVNSLKKLTDEADGFNFTVKEKLGDFVYVRLDEIVSNIQKIMENE